MVDVRDMSRRLYDILEETGVSERMRLLHRELAMTNEILYTVSLAVLSRRKIRFFLCGSNYEGSVSPELSSDVDIIHCDETVPVVLHPQAAPQGQSYLIARDRWTYPGYVKLQSLLNGRPMTLDDVFDTMACYGIDQHERVCWRHVTSKTVHGPTEREFIPGLTLQGPAGMAIFENREHLADNVVAHRCSRIPQFVDDWLTRRRKHNWPSKQHLKEMSTMGCMVVGAGSKDSPEKDVEWRLSFSLQERFLIANLNPGQHKCYVLLKMIKKNIFEKTHNIQFLSSYHCKTCILYMAEKTPSSMWTRENLVICLLQCLNLLLMWLTNGYCPNFFIREQNLFKRPEGFARCRKLLLKLMRSLLASGPNLLYSIQNDNIGYLLTEERGLSRKDHTDVVGEYMLKLKIRSIATVVDCQKYILLASKLTDEDIKSFFMNLTGLFPNIDTTAQYTADESKVAKQYIEPWLHFHVGMCTASDALRLEVLSDRIRAIDKANNHFQRALESSPVNVRLVEATVLLQTGKLGECFHLLHGIQPLVMQRKLYLCSCSGSDFQNTDSYKWYLPDTELPVSTLITSYVDSCVKFLPFAAEIVSSPLLYEMFRSTGTLPGSRNELKHHWFDWAVIDARVYFCFIQYLVSARLNKVFEKRLAVDILESLIQNEWLGHKETALNLLGWVYLQEQLVAEAVVCFMESWNIRPHHNAAKYHMRDVLMRLSSVWCADNFQLS